MILIWTSICEGNEHHSPRESIKVGVTVSLDLFVLPNLLLFAEIDNFGDKLFSKKKKNKIINTGFSQQAIVLLFRTTNLKFIWKMENARSTIQSNLNFCYYWSINFLLKKKKSKSPLLRYFLFFENWIVLFFFFVKQIFQVNSLILLLFLSFFRCFAWCWFRWFRSSLLVFLFWFFIFIIRTNVSEAPQVQLKKNSNWTK